MPLSWVPYMSKQGAPHSASICARSSTPRWVPIRRTPSVRTSMPISSRATSAMWRRYAGKPRMTLIFQAWISSIWRRVGVLAPLPDITGTAPV